MARTAQPANPCRSNNKEQHPAYCELVFQRSEGRLQHATGEAEGGRGDNGASQAVGAHEEKRGKGGKGKKDDWAPVEQLLGQGARALVSEERPEIGTHAALDLVHHVICHAGSVVVGHRVRHRAEREPKQALPRRQQREHAQNVIPTALQVQRRRRCGLGFRFGFRRQKPLLFARGHVLLTSG